MAQTGEPRHNPPGNGPISASIESSDSRVERIAFVPHLDGQRIGVEVRWYCSGPRPPVRRA
jgi:hypothetical protein